ncbi:hypothetical protein DV735_g2853, partial [Chaetothyriales sp. CBS 134920]
MNLPTTTTSTDRKFPKSIVGDVVAARFISANRVPVLLPRNIRQVLAFHKKKLLSDPRPGSSIPSEPVDILVDDTPSSDIWNLPAKPAVHAASSQSLIVRTMDPDFENTSRRSLRRLQDNIFQEDEAELIIDLISIRKRLNFKSTNRLREDGPPHKKVKAGQAKCLCTLTLWDNRTEDVEKDDEKTPLVKMHVNCTIVTYQAEDHSPQVNIELEQPFKVKAREFRVLSLSKDAEYPTLAIIDDYFLELKLIPLKLEADWPPIPIMGKSEGESQRRLAVLTAEKLKGSLVARYQKLPKAPESDIPLSIFFVHEGRLHKTKFGLELKAEWAKSPATPLPPNSAPVDPSPTQHKRVKISYIFDPQGASAHDIAKELRTVEVDDFGCPICAAYTAKDVLELRFHWLTMHSKYNLDFSSDERNARVRRLRFHVKPIPSGRPSKQLDDDKTFGYLSNGNPFDTLAFLDEQAGKSKQRPRTQPGLVGSRAQVVEDPASELRKRNGSHHGYLRPDDVRDFRKPARKKHPVVLLDRKIDNNRTAYSSISHRLRSISEDAMSETDDEISDEWFIDRHLEELDIIAQKEGWSDEKTEFLKKWNRHRLEEKLEHPRFISDSLVRFVKKEAALLAIADAGLRAAFADLLANLVQTRYIDIQFCVDLQALVRRLVVGAKQTPDDDAVSQSQAHDAELQPEKNGLDSSILEPSKLLHLVDSAKI